MTGLPVRTARTGLPGQDYPVELPRQTDRIRHDMDHEHGHAALTYNMEVQQGYELATRPYSMDVKYVLYMLYGHMSETCRTEKQH